MIIRDFVMAGMCQAMIIMMVIGDDDDDDDYFERVVRVHAGLRPKQVTPSNVLRGKLSKLRLNNTNIDSKFQNSVKLTVQVHSLLWTLEKENSKKILGEDPEND